MKQPVSTEHAPQAIGPYSQGILFSDLIFTSGQIPVNPADSKIPEGITEQTKQSLSNLKAVIEAAGGSADKILKVTVFLKDINDFNAMNEVYSAFFPKPFPARTCVEVSRLPKDVLVEIEAIAYK
ncbi:MAG: RidA family protein [Mucispirillum sp.]|nr:RidA family protein [Mucispirillum sp.]